MVCLPFLRSSELQIKINKPRNAITMDIPYDEIPAKFEQKDLILLHGAYKCMQREARATSEDPWRCHAARCQDMRRVVKHMMSCPSERKCSWPVSCSSLRQEVKRLTGCKEADCPICVQKKEWHVSVSAEQRSNIVDLLVQTASSSDPLQSRLRSLHDKVLYVQTMEHATYNKADNLTDYYRMLAAKKWEMEMDIQERSKLQTRLRVQADINFQENIVGERRRMGWRAYRLISARHDERPHIHRRVRPNQRI